MNIWSATNVLSFRTGSRVFGFVKDLYKGALGLFKNPSSHREVDYGDATEAAEVVLLADLLHRILNRTSVVAPAP